MFNRVKYILNLFKYVKKINKNQLKTCGVKVLIHDFVQIHNPEFVEMGDEIYIGPNVKIFGYGGVKIEKGVVIGGGVTIISANHNYDVSDIDMVPFNNDSVKNKVILKSFAWIGQNCILMPGVRMGKFSVLAAGSVLTKDADDYGVYGGNPAKLIKYRANKNIDESTKTWVSGKNSHHFIS